MHKFRIIASMLKLAVAVVFAAGCTKFDDSNNGNNNGGNGGNTEEPILPNGAINGVFTINDLGNKVYFSQGNLQYRASDNTWRFAENQYDYLGNHNGSISSSYNGYIDLFGWGTSGWDCGNLYYRPWDSNNNDDDCKLYGPFENNLSGQYANSDWGYYNKILNGENQMHCWRTLTREEWNFLFFSRRTPSDILFAKAYVNSTCGVILLPDNWSSSYYSLYNPNSNNVHYSNNVIDSATWLNSLQARGAVFLPAAGYRYGTSIYMIPYGYYWSSSSCNNSEAYSVKFDDYSLDVNYSDTRYYGNSVRLICPAE